MKIPPNVLELVLEYRSGERKLSRIGVVVFTTPQLAILSLLAIGLSEKNVAEVTGRSHNTIQKHSHLIKCKVRVRTNIGLTHFAIAHNLIKPGDYVD